jgi:hypothetical protein
VVLRRQHLNQQPKYHLRQILRSQLRTTESD